MTRTPRAAFVAGSTALLLAACSHTPAPPDAATLIRQAETAMGSAQLKTLQVAGRGTGGTFGQAWQPSMAWPALNYTMLSRAVNLDTGAFREEFGRSRAEANGGGAVPLMGTGEQRANGYLRDGFAWSMNGANAVPAPVASLTRLHDMLTSSPQGALKAAARFNATAGVRTVEGTRVNTLGFTAPGQYAATILFDATGLPTRIESTMPHPVLGDTQVVTEYSEWRDFGGTKFPARIKQSQGASPVLDWAITELKANEPVDINVPDNVRGARDNVTTEKVTEGVWFLAGGSHNSVAIELSDQILLVESPLYDGRALAVFEAANKLVPGKKVMTVVNSHHHFDHAGGLRAAAGEGATLVTSAMAKPYFERVFANPNSVAPDRLATSGRAPKISGVSGKMVITDKLRTVEVHEMQGSVHAQGFMAVWLPAEKLLIEADAYTPGPAGSPPPPVPNGNQVNLVQNIERLGMQVDRILPLHGRVVPVSELYTQIGRKPS
jgi:glyoxylase-like metal-dependent hydrolase (beta-lactamase superfamily II)